MNWKDVFVRAAKTAVQAFLGVATVAAVVAAFGPNGVDVSALEALGVSAGVAAAAAGWSVIQNAILSWTSS